MNEDELATLLRAAGAGVAVPPAPTDRILAAGRRRARRRRGAQVLGAVAAVAAVAVLVPLGLTRSAPDLAAAPSCPAVLAPAVLPDWARAGFSEPEPVSPFVLGDRGEIVAIPFGPLSSPPSPDRNNKILWVSHDAAPTGPLTITASAPGQATVVRELPDGPGPSIVDLPDPGCWTLQLRWSGHTDTLRLRYVVG